MNNLTINLLFQNILSLYYIVITVKNIIFNQQLFTYQTTDEDLTTEDLTDSKNTFVQTPKIKRQSFIKANEKIKKIIKYQENFNYDDNENLDPTVFFNPYNDLFFAHNIEKVIVAACLCPICNGPLYKYKILNIPMVDILCANFKYHIETKTSFLFQIKTTNGGFYKRGLPYFDKNFISIKSTFFKNVFCIDHLNPDFNIIIPNFICLVADSNYLINKKKSFFYFPNFCDPIKPYIINDHGLTINNHYIYKINDQFIDNIHNFFNKKLIQFNSDNLFFIDIDKNFFNKNNLNYIINYLKNNSENFINHAINHKFSIYCSKINLSIKIPLSLVPNLSLPHSHTPPILKQRARFYFSPDKKFFTPDKRTLKKSKNFTPSKSHYNSSSGLLKHPIDDSDSIKYKNKYFKYKTKYLTLKKNLNII
jgi:hypothetical protein